MSEKIKRNYSTLEEALAGLPKKTLKHSERVASYMRALFLQACAEDGLYISDPKVQVRLKESYADLTYAIGLYHDIGKVFLPEEYQNNDPDFTPEERTLYEKHASDSMAIIETMYRKETKCKAYEENYVREALAFHHETWNGTGFPNRLSGKNIPFFARLLAIADTFDHLACELHAENPFEDAIAKIVANSGAAFDPVLVDVFKKCKKKFKKIFGANLDSTNIIPETIPFVPLESGRPGALWYRPIEDIAGGKNLGVEADFRFKAKKLWLSYAEVGEIIQRENLKKDLGVYMALEACDFLRRVDACGINVPTVFLSFPTKWFNYSYAVPGLLSVLQDEKVDPARIAVVLTKDDFGESRASLTKSVARLKDAGVRIMFDRLTLDEVPVALPEETMEEREDGTVKFSEPQAVFHNRKKENGVITVEEILEMAPNMYRVGPADASQKDNDVYVAALKRLIAAGIDIMVRDVEPHDHKGFFYDLCVRGITGDFVGETLMANDFIKAELAVLN